MLSDSKTDSPSECLQPIELAKKMRRRIGKQTNVRQLAAQRSRPQPERTLLTDLSTLAELQAAIRES